MEAVENGSNSTAVGEWTDGMEGRRRNEGVTDGRRRKNPKKEGRKDGRREARGELEMAEMERKRRSTG